MRRTLVLLLISATAGAEPATVAYETRCSRVTFTYDSTKFTEPQMRMVVKLAPDSPDDYASAPDIERCIEGDSHYESCDSRDINAPNFLTNAEENIQITGARLVKLDGLPPSKDLEPVVGYVRKALAFSSWLEQARLSYYQSWDPEVLRAPYKGLDPKLICAKPLEELQQAVTVQERYDSAKLKWRVCMATAFHKKLGGYPLMAWNRFLKMNQIERKEQPFDCSEPIEETSSPATTAVDLSTAPANTPIFLPAPGPANPPLPSN